MTVSRCNPFDSNEVHFGAACSRTPAEVAAMAKHQARVRALRAAQQARLDSLLVSHPLVLPQAFPSLAHCAYAEGFSFGFSICVTEKFATRCFTSGFSHGFISCSKAPPHIIPIKQVVEPGKTPDSRLNISHTRTFSNAFYPGFH